MPMNGFNIGRDVSLNLIDGQVGVLRFGLVTNFNKKQETVDDAFKGLDGRTRRLRFIDGWTGTIMVERTDSNLDDYFARIEDGFYAGLTESPVTITETIQEVNGSVSQWRYLGVMLKYESGGDWSPDKHVTQTLSFVAERRRKIA